jgi:hypothetical protein
LFKYRELTFWANYTSAEFIKRLKSITEEPEDISQVVPMNIYKFKGTIGSGAIHLRYNGGVYVKALDVKIKIINKNPVKIAVYYRYPKIQSYFNIFFLLTPFIVYLTKINDLFFYHKKLYIAFFFGLELQL